MSVCACHNRRDRRRWLDFTHFSSSSDAYETRLPKRESLCLILVREKTQYFYFSPFVSRYQVEAFGSVLPWHRHCRDLPIFCCLIYSTNSAKLRLIFRDVKWIINPLISQWLAEALRKKRESSKSEIRRPIQSQPLLWIRRFFSIVNISRVQKYFNAKKNQEEGYRLHHNQFFFR